MQGNQKKGSCYLVVSNRPWNRGMPDRLRQQKGARFEWIDRREDLTIERLRVLQPRYVFFPHWSFLIPPEIHETFECVIFHMTDLPFGRGGSPLQNLISLGIAETRISALRCVAELDAGPVYMKRPLSLQGAAEEIYLRASGVMEEMIIEMVRTEPAPVPQTGEPVVFQRKRPEEGTLAGLDSLEQVFDRIRMLDATGYPPAFLEIGPLRLEFTRAALRTDHVDAQVRFTLPSGVARRKNEE